VAEVQVPDFISFLPERVWYLTQSGRDMWCRRPYTFFFSTSEAAEAFAKAMGTELALQAIGIASKELVSEEGIAALRKMDVTRVFVDPQVDPVSGDVFGTILRLQENN
jgi:hypothetical protein